MFFYVKNSLSIIQLLILVMLLCGHLTFANVVMFYDNLCTQDTTRNRTFNSCKYKLNNKNTYMYNQNFFYYDIKL